MNLLPPIRIEPFAPGDEDAFRALNREWLLGFALLEPADEKQLDDPSTHIFRPGGEIFVARLNGETVGCCAAIPHGDSVIEVAKLAVSPAAQGAGIGRRLVHAALRFGQARQCSKAILTSNARLTAALRLYESLGFEYRPIPSDVPYESVDVYMELDLRGWVVPRRVKGRRKKEEGRR